jgi:hypothetical protein
MAVSVTFMPTQDTIVTKMGRLRNTKDTASSHAVVGLGGDGLSLPPP